MLWFLHWLFLCLCSSLDRMLHILHQDYRISPQARCSFPVEVALPGTVLGTAPGILCLSRKSRGYLRWLQVYLALATKTVCLFWSAVKMCLSRRVAGLHEKSGIDLLFNFKSPWKNPGRESLAQYNSNLNAVGPYPSVLGLRIQTSLLLAHCCYYFNDKVIFAVY